MVLINIWAKLKAYLGFLLLSFMAMPLSALDFEEGQIYCASGGTFNCASVWTVEAIDTEGLIFKEEFRMTTPLNVMRRSKINWSVIRVKLISRYAYEGDFLCEQKILSSSFDPEINPRNLVVSKEMQENYLDWRKQQKRCYLFGKTCTKTNMVAKDVYRDFDYTLRKAYFYGNRDTDSKPWQGRPSYLVNQRREGDRLLNRLFEYETGDEIDAETWVKWRSVFEYLSWEDKHKRFRRGVRIDYDYCSK